MKLTYFGAACWLIESEAGRFLLDPGCLFGDGLSRNQARQLPLLTAVLITHFDPDHANRRFDIHAPVFGPGTSPPAPVTALPAKHGLRPWVRHTAYLLELEGMRLLHMGDSPRLEHAVPADLALVNVSGIACNVRQAMRLGDAVNAKVLLPMHHFQTPLTRRRGRQLQALSPREVVELEPGSSWAPPPVGGPSGSRSV